MSTTAHTASRFKNVVATNNC